MSSLFNLDGEEDLFDLSSIIGQPIKTSAEVVQKASDVATMKGIRELDKIKGVNPNSSNQFAVQNPQTPDEDPLYDSREQIYANLPLNDFVVPYENVLQKYHQVAWKFSLFTMRANEYTQVFLENPDADVSRIVVAESGVSGRYSINRVEIQQAPPASPGMTTNFSLNRCTIEIVENGGMEFVSELITMSNELAYQKYMDIPLVLELDFVGQDQETGKPQSIPGLNRKWSMQIINITANASPSGGTMVYTLQLSSTHAGVMVDSADWTLKEPYTCTASTFGGFLDDMKSKLNSMAVKQFGYLVGVYDAYASGEFYDIHCSDDVRELSINYSSKQSSTATSTAKDGSEGAKDFSWSANTPISKIVDDILDTCAPRDGMTDKRRLFVNIVPLRRYVGFDPIRNTSTYKNEFFVVKYEIGDITSVDEMEDKRKFNFQYFFENSKQIRQIVGGSTKLNIKRYDYQFSGLNTEIMDLQMKFDQTYSIAITRNPASQVDPSNIAGTHDAEAIMFDGRSYPTNDLRQVRELYKVAEDIQNEASATGRPLTEEEEQFIRDATAVSSQRTRQTLEEDTNLFDDLPVLAETRRFIEDYRDEYDLSRTGTQINHVPVQPENIVTNQSGSKPDSSSDDELTRRLMRDNYYNRGFLSTLEMKVVGDPYWLGWGDYSYRKYLERAVQGLDMDIESGDKNVANYITSQAYLLLNLKPLATISNETGIMAESPGGAFAESIYGVNRLVSTFGSDGTFTQVLHGGLIIRSLRREDEDYEGDTNG